MTSARKGRGAAIQFLKALAADSPANCVIWPFFKDRNGYGRLGYQGKGYWAHRLVCELAHGQAPSADHEAAHSCGHGKDGCVNPRHLAWATRTRNQLDRRIHGTKAHSGYRWHPKLTPVDVIQIRKYKGPMTQAELASTFGVSDATIRDVRSGKSWRRAAGDASA